jgi:predicted lipoprotein with Yx(FWY)xxD motif
MGFRWLAPAGLAAIALTIAACGSSSPSSGGSGGGASSATPGSGGASATAVVHSAKIGSATVLTNAKGRTLYWFVPDTSTTSNCNGSCASFWPPLKGPVTAGSGVTGTLGTITRSDGSTQASYNGHPLYTYVLDTAAGQAKGNGVNASGGVWHEVTVSGSGAPASSSPSSGGGGGYGY